MCGSGARSSPILRLRGARMTTLFDPIRIGDIDLANRIVMAPLTRNRAAPGQVPSGLAIEYYRQRASAGLIISEASPVCPEGQGYVDTPGIYNAEQVAAWRRITDAVHAEGGRIVVQLWHVGRISHVSLQPNGRAPVSSTARRAETKTFTRDGFVPVSTPRALRCRRDSRPGRELPFRGATSDGCRLRWRRGPRRERLPDRAIPARQHQRPGATNTAARSKTAPGCSAR